jgi:hypothetical protein
VDRHRIILPRQQLTPTRPHHDRQQPLPYLRRQAQPNITPNPHVQHELCPIGEGVTSRALSFKRVQVVISSSLAMMEYTHVGSGLRNPRAETSARQESMARLRTLNSQGRCDLVESARNTVRRKVWDASQATVSRRTRGAVSESGGGQEERPAKKAREIQITPFTPPLSVGVCV